MAGGAIEAVDGKTAITNKLTETLTVSQTPAAKMLLGIGVTVKARHAIEPLQATQRAPGPKDLETFQVMTQAFSVSLYVSNTDDEECCIILLFSHQSHLSQAEWH